MDFIIGGAQKCGTTALFHFIRSHGRIFIPKNKELHFFDNERIDWSNPDYGILHRNFKEAKRGHVCGEATPIYIYWEPSIERIHKYNPQIKLIFIFRNPVHRAFSHWRMEKARGAEHLPFSRAIREGRKRVEQEGEIKGYHRVYSYVERGFYARQLDRVFSFFPRDQVLLLKQEDLKRNPKKVMDMICDFLQVERFETYPEFKTVFSHGEDPSQCLSKEDKEYLYELYKFDLIRLYKAYGIKFEDL